MCLILSSTNPQPDQQIGSTRKTSDIAAKLRLLPLLEVIADTNQWFLATSCNKNRQQPANFVQDYEFQQEISRPSVLQQGPLPSIFQNFGVVAGISMYHQY